MVQFDGIPVRTFDGSRRVTIWEQTADGENLVCVSDPDISTFRAGRTLPTPVSFRWFVSGKPECMRLGPGLYRVKVVWVINEDDWVLERTVVRETIMAITDA